MRRLIYEGRPTSELQEIRRSIIDDPTNHTPRDGRGHPIGTIYLYTPKAMKKLDAIARAIANNCKEKATA